MLAVVGSEMEELARRVGEVDAAEEGVMEVVVAVEEGAEMCEVEGGTSRTMCYEPRKPLNETASTQERVVDSRKCLSLNSLSRRPP